MRALYLPYIKKPLPPPLIVSELSVLPRMQRLTESLHHPLIGYAHSSGAEHSFFESALRHRICNPGKSVDSPAVLAVLHRRTEIYLGKTRVLFADIVHDKKTVPDESNILRKTAPFQDICS